MGWMVKISVLTHPLLQRNETSAYPEAGGNVEETVHARGNTTQ